MGFGAWANPGSDEVRALWVLRTSLVSSESIAVMVKAAQSNGFNTLLVQVRPRGDAFYNSSIEPRASQLAAAPRFDPLAEVIAQARVAGLQVHAWVNVNLVSSAVDLPIARNHLVHRHPEWLMVPRALAQGPASIDPTSRKFLDTLARWIRSRPQELEGLYVSPVLPAASHHTVSVVTDLVTRYGLDGVHLDYIRYPNEQFDYSRAALAAFRAELLPRMPPADRRRLAGQAAANPLAYVDQYPEAWIRFRRSTLTGLVQQITTAVKAARPETIISAAVIPDREEASSRRLQDWATWLELGLLDVVCPLAYTQDAGLFANQIAAARALPGTHGLWAGIGAYQLSASQTIANIAAARRLGASGLAFFSYDAMTGSPAASASLAEVGRGFGPATPPTSGSRPGSN